MLESHAFGNFIPSNSQYLILDSFSARQAVKGTAVTDENYDWFYGTKRNQFWPILAEVYGIKFINTQAKKDFFTRSGIAIADIIYTCERKAGNNLDSNLIVKSYNIDPITDIFENFSIKSVFFTSRYVEKRLKVVFKSVFLHHPCVQYVTLPSPSPRYGILTKEQKIQIYKDLLPKFDN